MTYKSICSLTQLPFISYHSFPSLLQSTTLSTLGKTLPAPVFPSAFPFAWSVLSIFMHITPLFHLHLSLVMSFKRSSLTTLSNIYHLHILFLILCPYCYLYSTYTAIIYFLTLCEKVNKVGMHFVLVILNFQQLEQCLLT